MRREAELYCSDGASGRSNPIGAQTAGVQAELNEEKPTVSSGLRPVMLESRPYYCRGLVSSFGASLGAGAECCAGSACCAGCACCTGAECCSGCARCTGA